MKEYGKYHEGMNRGQVIKAVFGSMASKVDAAIPKDGYEKMSSEKQFFSVMYYGDSVLGRLVDMREFDPYFFRENRRTVLRENTNTSDLCANSIVIFRHRNFYQKCEFFTVNTEEGYTDYVNLTTCNPVTGLTNKILRNIDVYKLRKWILDRVLIQDVWSDEEMNPSDRELLMSGIGGDFWATLADSSEEEEEAEA